MDYRPKIKIKGLNQTYIWPAVIAAGASIAGGLMANRSAAKAQSRSDAQNYAMQKEFAQHGIRWKMADAEAAGIHPMYAMGATGASAQASFRAPDTSAVGKGLAKAGSSIANAMQVSTTQKLQNDLLRSQIDGVNIDNAEGRIRLTKITGRGPGIPTAQQKYEMPIYERLMSSGNQLQNLEEYPGTYRLDGRQYDIGDNSTAQHLEDMVGDVFGGALSLGSALQQLPKNLWNDFKRMLSARNKKYGKGKFFH